MREYMLTTTDFNFMQSLALDRAGILFDDSNKNSIYNRLSKRIYHLHLDSFTDYCRLLQKDELEVSHFINLITNTHTSFFRENHHFDYFKTNILPQLIKEKSKIRLWSSCCATGEEAYSMAIAIKEAKLDLSKVDIKILATDINTEALKIAEAGKYQMTGLNKLSADRLSQWFTKLPGNSLYEVNEDLKKMISFRYLNLILPWPMRGRFDVIFCRNTFIYLDKKIVQQLLMRFYQYLEPNGILILGHSEGACMDKGNFVAIDRTIYRKQLVRTTV